MSKAMSEEPKKKNRYAWMLLRDGSIYEHDGALIPADTVEEAPIEWEKSEWSGWGARGENDQIPILFWNSANRRDAKMATVTGSEAHLYEIEIPYYGGYTYELSATSIEDAIGFIIKDIDFLYLDKAEKNTCIDIHITKINIPSKITRETETETITLQFEPDQKPCRFFDEEDFYCSEPEHLWGDFFTEKETRKQVCQRCKKEHFVATLEEETETGVSEVHFYRKPKEEE
jgi:hypothetical protein